MRRGEQVAGAGSDSGKGLEKMRTLSSAGMVGAAIGLVAAVGFGTAAAAQELSENSLRSFMEYAWSLTPSKFTRPDGRTIEIDKKKKEEIMVAPDVAREVIKVGRISAYAQVCELGEAQIANYRSLMIREEQKKKWTEQQLIYINQLHLTTVMMLTGKVKVVDVEGEKKVEVEETKSKPQTCSDEQRSKVAELITAYVKAGPPLESAAAPAAPSTTGAVVPAAAPAAKAPPAKK